MLKHVQPRVFFASIGGREILIEKGAEWDLHEEEDETMLVLMQCADDSLHFLEVRRDWSKTRMPPTAAARASAMLADNLLMHRALVEHFGFRDD